MANSHTISSLKQQVLEQKAHLYDLNDTLTRARMEALQAKDKVRRVHEQIQEAEEKLNKLKTDAVEVDNLVHS